MRTVPTDLATHIAGTTTSLCRIMTITRADGTIKRIADTQDELVVSGDTYEVGRGISISAIQTRNDGSSSNVTITIAADNTVLDFGEVLSGFYDQAAVSISVVNHLDVTDGVLEIFAGQVGDITADDRGSCAIECRGLTQLARAQVAPKYQPTCRVDLGTEKCGIPIMPDDVARSTAYAVGDVVRKKTGGSGWTHYNNVYYECTTAGTTASGAVTYTTTVGATTTDGTAVFTCRNAWLRYGVVATVVDEFNFTATLTEPRAVNDWFKWGCVIWRSGLSAGTMVECRGWVQSTSTVTIMMPTIGTIAPGDEFEIFAGCDKRASTCSTRFNNILNFRGEPHVPGPMTA